jgi:hypothetical protein
MKTRGSVEKRREKDNERAWLYYASEEYKEKKKKSNKESYKRKRMEERVTQDRLLQSTEKVEELKMALRKATIPEVPQFADHHHLEETHENVGAKSAEVLEVNGNDKMEDMTKMEEIIKMYLSDTIATQNLTLLDTCDLELLHEETCYAIDMRTW